MGPDMEPLLRAWSCFRRRKFRQCAELCSQLLEAVPGEQVAGPGGEAGPGAPRGWAGLGWGGGSLAVPLAVPAGAAGETRCEPPLAGRGLAGAAPSCPAPTPAPPRPAG